MKIYYDYSARGIKRFRKHYLKIYQVISKLKHKHLNTLTVDKNDRQYIKNFYDGSNDNRIKHFKKTMKWIGEADAVVLEVSLPSLSMGYLMQEALGSNKPVIALHLKNHQPHFALGAENERLQVVEYEDDNIEEVLKYSLDYASDQQDTRFNFFISPKHQNYLDWIANNKKIPRSVYLRDLIEKDMEQNGEYGS